MDPIVFGKFWNLIEITEFLIVEEAIENDKTNCQGFCFLKNYSRYIIHQDSCKVEFREKK